MMFKKLSIIILGLSFAIALSAAAKAETVFEKASRTGVVTFGTRTDTIPYAFVNDKKQLVGYSIDIVELIRKDLESQTGRPITIEFSKINDPSEQIQKVARGDIDLACSTQFTWQREQYVDFSIPYSLSGIRLLIKSSSNLTELPASLAGKRVGVVPNSMGETVMKKIQPKAVLVSFSQADEAYAELKNGKIDAIAGDTVVLAGNLLRTNPKEEFELAPLQPYGRYGVGCIVPQNNSMFLNSINRAIAKLMQGYVIGNKQYVDMVNRWIGPKGLVEFSEDLIRTYFETVILSHEQIPVTEAPQAKRPSK